MLESFQQRCTAALGRPTPISADSHQNDQLARKQASNTVQHKSGTGSVLLQQPTGERLNPSFAQSRIVIELKGIQRLSIHANSRTRPIKTAVAASEAARERSQVSSCKPPEVG